jgi:hypothetical protein
MAVITSDVLDPKTPASVNVVAEAPAPRLDPTLGIPVALPNDGTPRHRLVAVGDSLTQGFQSGAIFNTDLSFPMIVAWELGWDGFFRHPRYDGLGGLPFNIEYVIRRLENDLGMDRPLYKLPLAYFELRHILAQIADWWNRGPGSLAPNLKGIMHNLAVWGWDLRDFLERNLRIETKLIVEPQEHFFLPLVSNANELTALRVFNDTEREGRSLTLLEAAAALGKEGTCENGQGDGIETLLVSVGANNALGSVVKLRVSWSKSPEYQDLTKKNAFTVWDPEHFAAELRFFVQQVANIRARHVIWTTVPHVTIAPIARGVGDKVRSGSRYYPYYTRPWISDREFDPANDPHITGPEARAVDSAIDQYNDAIAEAVRAARAGEIGHQPRDWYLFDLAGQLDRLAFRRYIDDPRARPRWWTPYELPASLQRLDPVPDSRFFTANREGRESGGLFSLDGVHPTTIGYGLIAQEVINIMQRAGVRFFNHGQETERRPPILVDFDRLIAADTLISDPPASISGDLKLLGWLNDKLDLFKRVFQLNLI